MANKIIQNEKKITTYRVLARRMRPKQFSDIVGQNVTVHLISQAFLTHRLPHSFLLTGTRGVGKTTTARLIAQTLNCLTPCIMEKRIEPCLKCDACWACAHDQHMDIMEFDAASHTGVDDIRDILTSCTYMPLLSPYKVFIIDEVHMLSKSAFNALLKTLEEPPAHVKFILATTELQKVPLTIVSRCLQFHLRHLTTQDIAHHLEHVLQQDAQYSAEPEALQLLARQARGSLRDGLSLLDQALLMAPTHATHADNNIPMLRRDAVIEMLGIAQDEWLLELMQNIMRGDTKTLLAQLSVMRQEGVDIMSAMQSISSYVHILNLLHHGADDVTLNMFSDATVQKLRVMAQEGSASFWSHLWQMTLKGWQEVTFAPHADDVFEMLLLRMSIMRTLPPIESIINHTSSTATNFTSLLSSDAHSEHQTAYVLSSFDALKTLLERHRQGWLIAHLNHAQTQCHDFHHGCIKLSMAQPPKDFTSRLQTFLNECNEIKKIDWKIDLISVPLQDVRQHILENDANVLNAREVFPDLILEDIRQV